ncbi:MAG: SDR family NAD(P)-dependent oxidoreductase, partial [Chloroflexota bacterium]
WHTAALCSFQRKIFNSEEKPSCYLYQPNKIMSALTNFETKTALVTGANSGLGFEAAAQLAEAGYGRVILACRNLEKAEAAKIQLSERVGHDRFDTLEIDVSSIASAEMAAAELVNQSKTISTLLLNAGIVSGKEMKKSADGIEMTFAA